MNKFQRGKIYAIRSADSDMVYIGSTISTLRQRLFQHRAKFKACQAGKSRYITSFQLMELGGHYIELVENYPCADRNELSRREGEIMRETVGCINENIAGRTKAEWYQDNRERILIKQKQYNQNNKEAIAIRDGQKFKCECGGKYTHEHKARHSRTQRHQAFINA